MKRFVGIAFMVLCAAVLCSQPSWREQVGKQPDGSFLLSTGWRDTAGGDAGAAGHAADVVGAVARRQISAGAERRIPAAVHQRAERVDDMRRRFRACRWRTVAGADVFTGW